MNTQPGSEAASDQRSAAVPHLVVEILKFGVTGGLGTITNLLIFFVLVDLLGLPPIPISIACFLVAGTQNYFLNHLWSFKKYTAETPPSVKKWFAFLSGSLLGLAVNIVVMNLALANYDLPWKFIAQGCGIASGMVINFVISKLLVFRKTPAAEE
jgi:putative flippase GtrA